jgi:hypothetical protein
MSLGDRGTIKTNSRRYEPTSYTPRGVVRAQPPDHADGELPSQSRWSSWLPDARSRRGIAFRRVIMARLAAPADFEFFPACLEVSGDAEDCLLEFRDLPFEPHPVTVWPDSHPLDWCCGRSGWPPGR